MIKDEEQKGAQIFQNGYDFEGQVEGRVSLTKLATSFLMAVLYSKVLKNLNIFLVLLI